MSFNEVIMKLSNSKIIYIVAFIVVIVIIILFINYLATPEIKLSGHKNADAVSIISSNKLVNKENTNNYTYSIWIYVNNWNYRYGEDKIIFERVDNLGNPMPSIKLGALENNITISVSCYPGATGTSKPSSSTKVQTTTAPVIKDCVIRNVPIQRWTNIIISLYGRTLDTYLDGKLVRTCVLPGVPQVEASSKIFVTPHGGFSGFTSNLLYRNTSSNPTQAYNIYKQGTSMTNILGKFFNKYKLKFSLLENSNVKGSIEI